MKQGIVFLVAQESEGVPENPHQVQAAPPKFAGTPYVPLLYGERVIGMRTLVRDELCIQGGISSPAVVECSCGIGWINSFCPIHGPSKTQ